MTNNNIQGKQSFKNMASMLKGSQNPMGILQMLAGKNPQLNQVMSMLNTTNMTPKQLFTQMAQQQGVDINEIMNMLK
jgi:hypothetical protein